jgi:hypothetical protein
VQELFLSYWTLGYCHDDTEFLFVKSLDKAKLKVVMLLKRRKERET